MMNNTKNKLDMIKAGGYEIDFTETFNDTFELYKKMAVSAGLVFMLLAIVGGAVLVGMIGAIVGFAALSENLAGFDPAKIPPVYLVGYVLFVALISGLFAPFTAGIIKMARQADLNEPITIGTAFDYYSSHYFKYLFTAAFLIALFTVGLSTLFDVLGLPLIGPLVSAITSFLTLLTIPLIIFGELKPIEAIRGSIIAIAKNPWIILGLWIVTFIASLVGFIAFCIGYFFTAPILYALYYAIYKHAIGVQVTTEIDQIGL